VRLDTALWRAIAVYRLAALLYAAGSMVAFSGTYARPSLGWAVLSGMVVWTAGTAVAYSRTELRRWPLFVADLALTVTALLSTVVIMSRERIEDGDPTVTVSWAATPVLVWAVWSGWTGGAVAAAAVGGTAVLVRGGASQATVNSLVLLFLLGAVVGYVVQLARQAQAAYAEAVALQSAAAERERLSRSVHDGVLQALALVSRRSSDPQLAALAADQEAALRRLLVGGRPEVLATGADVHLAVPASPVLLPGHRAQELAAAVGEAVDNARRHARTDAWLLVEDEPDGITVTVRDDGPGIPDGRLAQAARDGRLGVAQSICGRLRDLGGTVDVHSASGQGTEVELRVPR
jgi:signal transduction histidine kinase